MGRSKWTAEERSHALELYHEHGPRAAAKQTGIPFGTISRWAREAGQSYNPERTAKATEVRQLRWAERRATLTDLLGLAAEELVQKSRKHEGAREAKDYMVAAAVAVEKAQLLSGGVTTRHEVLDAQKRRARVQELADELAARRAARSGEPAEAGGG